MTLFHDNLVQTCFKKRWKWFSEKYIDYEVDNVSLSHRGGPIKNLVNEESCLKILFLCDTNKKASIRWQDSVRRQFQAGLIGDVGL